MFGLVCSDPVERPEGCKCVDIFKSKAIRQSKAKGSPGFPPCSSCTKMVCLDFVLFVAFLSDYFSLISGLHVRSLVFWQVHRVISTALQATLRAPLPSRAPLRLVPPGQARMLPSSQRCPSSDARPLNFAHLRIGTKPPVAPVANACAIHSLIRFGRIAMPGSRRWTYFGDC